MKTAAADGLDLAEVYRILSAVASVPKDKRGTLATAVEAYVCGMAAQERIMKGGATA